MEQETSRTTCYNQIYVTIKSLAMGKSPQSKATKKVEKSTSFTAAAAPDQFSLRATANEDISNEDHVWSLDDEDLIKEEKSSVQAEEDDVVIVSRSSNDRVFDDKVARCFIVVAMGRVELGLCTAVTCLRGVPFGDF